MRPHRGYTLIELIFGLAVAGVLMGLAVPAVTGAIEATRSASTEMSLLTSLSRSVHRAAITGTHSVLCPSRDGTTCVDDVDWSHGWIAFLDPNANRERDAGEPLISSETVLPGRVRLRSSVGRTRIVFQGNGGNAGSNVTFTLCDGRGPSRAKTLVLSNQGRFRHGTPTAAALAATCMSG